MNFPASPIPNQPQQSPVLLLHPPASSKQDRSFACFGHEPAFHGRDIFVRNLVKLSMPLFTSSLRNIS